MSVLQGPSEHECPCGQRHQLPLCPADVRLVPGVGEVDARQGGHQEHLIREVNVLYDHGRIATVRIAANWPAAYREDIEDRLVDIVTTCLPPDMQPASGRE